MSKDSKLQFAQTIGLIVTMLVYGVFYWLLGYMCGTSDGELKAYEKYKNSLEKLDT